MAVFNERDPKKRIELARKFIHDYPESDLKDYAIQIAGPSDRPGISGPVYRLDEGVSPPSILYRVEPTYSKEGRKANIQGVVVLSAIVRKDGNIEIVKVVRGLGYGLDENGISALKQWKFRPGMMNGVPVDVALNVEVNFSLR
jgi:TonB family protein